MKSYKIAQNIEKKEKNIKKDVFFYSIFTLSCIVFLFSLNLLNFSFSKDFLNSLKNTIQTLKPTEELFDDNGGVRLVSILFPITSTQVNSQILNFKFKIDSYDNAVSNDGVITLNNPSGLLYANESGYIQIESLNNEYDELKIKHNLGTESVYSGKFIFGVKDGQYVEKGEPLAVVLSPKLEFYITNNGEIISTLVISQGELSWID